MTTDQIEGELCSLADAAMGSAIAVIQQRLGVVDGDAAAQFFDQEAGQDARHVLVDYIKFQAGLLDATPEQVARYLADDCGMTFQQFICDHDWPPLDVRGRLLCRKCGLDGDV